MSFCETVKVAAIIRKPSTCDSVFLPEIFVTAELGTKQVCRTLKSGRTNRMKRQVYEYLYV